MINSREFVAKIKNVILGEDHELVSFDVKSLFTSIPLELAIESVKEALTNYSDELPIPKEKVIDLLTLCLHSTYFQYDGNFYQSKTNEDKKVIAAIPYVKGTSERIARILRPHNILVAHKPLTTLRDVLTKVKDPSPKNSRVGAIYKIACSECPASYVGETGTTLRCRVKEHKRCIANKDTSNRIAVHHMTTNHQMDWERATCLALETNFSKRMFLESWHSNSDKNSINISRDMPGAYFSLIANERARAECKRTREQSRDHAADASCTLKINFEVFENGFCERYRNVRQNILKFCKIWKNNKEIK